MDFLLLRLLLVGLANGGAQEQVPCPQEGGEPGRRPGKGGLGLFHCTRAPQGLEGLQRGGAQCTLAELLWKEVA